MKRKFLLGDILSITTGKILSPINYDGAWDLVNFMAGDILAVEQMVSFRSKCREFILDQYPELKDLGPGESTSTNVEDWLNQQKEKFGESLEIEPVPKAKKKIVERFGVKIGHPLP